MFMNHSKTFLLARGQMEDIKTSHVFDSDIAKLLLVTVVGMSETCLIDPCQSSIKIESYIWVD